jgi:predicted RNA-binding Zn ribbon-like protein
LGVDLLNTVWLDAAGRHDLLDDPVEAAAWLAEHDLVGGVGRLIQTRETLRAWLQDEADERAVNAILARCAERPVLRDGELTTQLTGDAAWFAAWTAARDLVGRRGPRLKRCANLGCVLWFYDTSRGGRRRWCSMAICGNRDKVRRHHERTSG